MGLHTLHLQDHRKRLDLRLPFPFANELRGEQYNEPRMGEEDCSIEKSNYKMLGSELN